MGPEEAAAAAVGIVIEEFDFGRSDDEGIGGLLVVEPIGADATRVVALVRPGTAPALRETFAAWVVGRVTRFVTGGPEVDGWQRRESDGAWQTWARLVDLPPLD